MASVLGAPTHTVTLSLALSPGPTSHLFNVTGDEATLSQGLAAWKLAQDLVQMVYVVGAILIR